ncbi:hypothetical protein M569_08246 [Genlisea aurea]|uniref:Phytocyanin domain-containing protein n=1 Tax=Genlisea aurea TaxID=192259 RepID=S8CIH8_9LAMI|nr:hypothetical protein M569_08246 [Genlisea aurea]
MAATQVVEFYLVAALSLVACAASAGGYTNHTVGGNAGWFFNSITNETSADYSAWAAAQTFNLGDFLIFNTDTNQTVIQTFNSTTYGSCSTDNALDSDTFQYDDGGNGQSGDKITIPVPLTIEGPQYYFSDADDGIPCLRGMAFKITVSHGLGLPPSLNQPPPPPFTAPPPFAEGDSPPILVIGTPGNHGIGANPGLHWLLLVLYSCSFLAWMIS